MSKYNVSFINGDGIGPELTESGISLLEEIGNRSSLKFKIDKVYAGDEAIRLFGTPLPDESKNKIFNSDVCLKSPVGESAADVIVFLRRYLNLYANVRPAKTYPGLDHYARKDVDLVIVRENTEDLYVGWEFNLDENNVIALRLTTKDASERIARFAFETSLNRNKGMKVTAVHKSNVLRKGDGLFLNVCRNVSERYPKILFNDQYVDACSMNLIRDPSQYDVILTTNLFGDILSDEAAQIVGGLGMGPAANIGDDYAIFEPVHGAAFDIAGKNIANPCSIFLSIRMMLEWLYKKYNEKEALMISTLIENNVMDLLISKERTKDIGGNLSTKEFTQAFIKRLRDKF